MMRRHPYVWALLALSLPVACGEEGPVIVELDLAPTYDGVGVARIARQLSLQPELRVFELRFEQMRLAGGRVQGELTGEGSQVFLLDGRYDAAGTQVRFDGRSGTLTSTGTELVVNFGFRLEEGGPVDGVASELVGFVATATLGATAEGRWIAVEDRPDRLDTPDPSRVSVGPSTRIGRVIVEGASGASVGGAGLQIIRYSVDLDVPDVFSTPVGFDGDFILEIPGVPGDVLLLRAQSARRSSGAAALRIPE